MKVGNLVLTFFKLLPKKAEVGTEDAAPVPFKASYITFNSFRLNLKHIETHTRIQTKFNLEISFDLNIPLR